MMDVCDMCGVATPSDQLVKIGPNSYICGQCAEEEDERRRAEEEQAREDYEADMRMDLSREEGYSEATNFDKFMDSTLLTEQKRKTQDEAQVSPQRRIARGYQEHPLGKVRVGGRRA